jgi:hypothetical protein
MKILGSLAFGLLLLWASPARSQTPVNVNPDCTAGFAFNATGSYTTYANVQGCVTWTVVYNSTGFSALSLVFQSAPGNPTGTPGSFVTYPGTTSTGVNPNINTAGGVSVFANGAVSTPFVRMTLTSASGTGLITGTIYGWRTGSGGGGGGGGGSGCAGTVTTPCVTGAENSAGAAITDNICDLSAPFSISSTGETQIIAAVSGKQIRLCHISFSSNAVSNMAIEQGTGTNCGTGTALVAGTYQNVLTFALDWTPRASPIFTSGTAACLNFTTSVSAGGVVVYAQF